MKQKALAHELFCDIAIYSTDTYLPYSTIYLPCITPFMRASEMELLVPFLSPLVWCCRRIQNPRPPAPKADTLPTELSGRLNQET